MTDSEPCNLPLEPPLVAHYTKAQTAFADILGEQVSLMMSPLATMRDPHESRSWNEPGAFWVRSVQKIGCEAGYDRVIGAMNREGKHWVKVLSTTVDHPANDDGEEWGRCFAHPRLWEYYADKHTGVCLVLRSDGVEAGVKQHHEEQRVILHRGDNAVRYGSLALPSGDQHDPYFWHPSEDILDGEACCALPAGSSLADFVAKRNAVYCKSPDWESEAEYRFVMVIADKEPVFVKFDQSPVECVIVGHRFPNWQLEGAKKVCDTVGARLCRGEWHSAGLQLSLVR